MNRQRITEAIRRAYPNCPVTVTFERTGKDIAECRWPLEAAKVLKSSPLDVLLRVMSNAEPGDGVLYMPPGLIYAKEINICR